MDSTKSGTTHPLEIKKSAVMRTLKDYELYKKEMSESVSKFESLKSDGDDHELRRAKDVMDESGAVLEFTRKRLAGYASDLDLYIRETILPILHTDKVPPMCKSLVRDAKKYLDELNTKHPEVGFKFATKTA